MTEIRFLVRRAAWLLLGLAPLPDALAQASAAAAPPPPQSPSSAQAAERARRESERTLYWIRIVSDKPAARPQASAAPPAPLSASSARAGHTHVAETAARVAPSQSPGTAARVPATTTAAAPSTSDSVDAPSGLAAAARPEVAAAPAPDAAAPADALGALAAPTLAASAGAGAVPEAPDPGLELVGSVDPAFPVPLMMRLRKGQVEVRFEVDADGHVTAASVESSTHRGLEAAALDAVRQWRFKPATRGHTALVDLAFDMDS